MTNLSKSEAEHIAHTILYQLGSQRRLVVFCGAKDFMYLPEGGVQFSIGKGAKRGVKKVVIKLNANDLYDLSFGHVCRKTFEWVEVSSAKDIYNDMLMDVFEEHTGLFLTLSPRR